MPKIDHFTNQFTQTGGLAISGRNAALPFNVTWPMADLTVSSSELHASALWMYYVFPKDKLIRLSRHKGLFCKGLKITHSILELPESVVFWTFRLEQLEAALTRLGYVVDDKPFG